MLTDQSVCLLCWYVCSMERQTLTCRPGSQDVFSYVYVNLHLEYGINRKPVKFVDEHWGRFKKEKKKEKKRKNVVFCWAG